MKSILSALLVVAASSLAFAGAPAAKNPKAPVAPAPAPGCDALSYTYIEPGWLHLDSRAGTSDGGFVDFNYDLGHNLFFDGTANLLSGDFDYQEYGAGLGAYFPVTSKFHLVGRTGWAYTDTDPGAGVHEWYISPGFRYQVTCNLELYGKAYLHVTENENSWSGGGGLLYHVCKAAAVDVGGAWGDDDEWSIQVGLRFQL